MKNILIIALGTVVLICCKQTTEKTNSMANNEDQVEKSISSGDTTTPKVTGIGGVFFYSGNPDKTKEWYTKNLGIEINDWGSSSFVSRDLDNPDRINSLQWTPFKSGDEYFSPSKREFMINYRVQNIEGLLNKLKENGVTILDSITTYDGIGNSFISWTRRTIRLSCGNHRIKEVS